ncbi:hypothetical protein RN001_014814 [Aquatica leii]|uniref:La-related protein 7 n=1 Tax=Aquatica leii TaxID=1421715 RepID=A0AAN7NUY4_9COLE|nr:hypothetical protein RN001_014814 [Aquatica leii]
MEFYFSDSNLSKERFLGQLIQNDPYVDVSIFLNFNKIRKLTSSIDDVTKAISKSDLIELSEDRTKVRRKAPIQVKQNVDECTIYVERLKSDATHEWLTSIFSEFGSVVYVSIPKYPHSNIIKGFAFVEFENEDGANSALNFFESIDCKIPSVMEPQKLYSIATFDCKNPNNKMKFIDTDDTLDAGTEKNESRKRKLSTEADEETELKHEDKKVKKDEGELNGNEQKTNEVILNEDGHEHDTTESEEERKRKKQKKSHRKRATLKEIGLHVLSKKDWKKMRNKYLEMQRKTMTELKRHLNKQKSSEPVSKPKEVRNEAKVKEEVETKSAVQEFVPGIIVKVALTDPLVESKKLKDELKTNFPDVQYIDIPHTYGSQEIYIRFKDSTSADSFCTKNFKGNVCTVLEGDEENKYWQRIEESRNAKLRHANRKQRGRDKLLKKAEKQSAQHIRFDD